MNIELSIVIPSYNRYPLNKLALYSLTKQNFDMSKFEVLLIDDASTDETPKLEHSNFPYSFRYIRNSSNLGLSRSRNIGIKKARGNVIIFLDAEVIVDPQFLDIHFLHHRKNKRAVVTGGSINQIYSILFPEFHEWQWKNVQNLMKGNEAFKNKVWEALGRRVTKGELPEVIKESGVPVKTVHRDDINQFEVIRRLSTSRPYEAKLFSEMGYNGDGYHSSWLFCIGLNHSVKKSFIDSVGAYDEEFKGWGLEDYEFGYRLSQAGAHYIADPNLHLYHQEHPVKPTIHEEAARNMMYFQQKHPVIDVCIRALQYLGFGSEFLFLEKALQDYHTLSKDYPDLYGDFKRAVLLMLMEITRRASQNNWRLNHLLTKAVSDNQERRTNILAERDAIHAYGQYDSLVEVFDKLVSS